VIGVVFVCGKQALLVPAVRAAHEHGFMPEAYGGAERIALARGEMLFAVFTYIFFFGGVLCSYHSGNAEPEENQRNAYYCDYDYERMHMDLLKDDVFYRYSFLW
jgi:hypothetical protein